MRKRRLDGMNRAAGAVALGLLAAAVLRELRLPGEDRRWRGRVFGVPYDLRPPTPARIRRSWWRPEEERLFVEPVWGVGWELNLARVASLFRATLRGVQGSR